MPAAFCNAAVAEIRAAEAKVNQESDPNLVVRLAQESVDLRFL